MIIYCDGKFVDSQEAKISVFDHGFLYGDGVFEGIRAYNGRVFKLKEHIDRLYESANAILLNVEISRREMMDIVVETVRKNNLTDAYIRLIISRGVGDMGLDPRKCAKSEIICIAGNISLYPPSMYENGMEIITAATRRTSSDALSPRIKSLNYLNNIMAKIEANRASLMEALMLNQEGYVSEATGDNIFIIKDGIITTPPVYAGILKGVTRDSVIDLARQEGITVQEELFHLIDVYSADECFLTGTAAELIPIIMLDSRKIGDGKPGPVFKKLLAKFHEYVKTEGEPI
ncbi:MULTISPECIES: branched-chain-amino-acid transaminase [Dehalobacter]|jgi:branched-chain amino acid aminotransferase|uniref:Branched-chain-amino-acid aminotransferase n=2 Tax=Dehalobacter restrictus TaxID=55583 RepID=A0A857DHK8_9FIRM|nr:MULTISPECIES: branched-chain-amino-acid transaminase [Dehalobacter]AHF10194.1 branched-chain amino acid aminotransferase [Dehalobacter restrictus DSM 9455]MCG1024226.1 branched-chain-amino-acid transaminase [Dehalobacter sp.]MDJ0307171.1 branched-chain-amino-acid transaminase [Dehalobacter sp.]OCZ50457.1 branched-chain-amino-acid transaminase [Dehalobacter sp. TeCB1]QHA00784.1 branched-chain-amino-acid transaminase [Dehalobacter restrictus]